jgi:hypothetical protein
MSLLRGRVHAAQTPLQAEPDEATHRPTDLIRILVC